MKNVNVTRLSARKPDTLRAIVYDKSVSRSSGSKNQLAMSAPMKEGANDENGVCTVKFTVKVPDINPAPTETRWFVNGEQVATGKNTLVQEFTYVHDLFSHNCNCIGYLRKRSTNEVTFVAYSPLGEQAITTNVDDLCKLIV